MDRVVSSTLRPSAEWPEVSPLRPAKRSRLAILATVLMLVIAVGDVFLHSNNSPLYLIPILLFAWSGTLRPLWRTAGPMILFTFLSFFLKNHFFPYTPGASFFDVRLLNRAFVAVMILVMCQSLQLWTRWREDQSDTELPVYFRHQEQEIGATFAMLCCAPLVILIGLIDFMSPANINWAILYPIPLFICGWTGSRRLLWAMLALLLVLTGGGYFLGPPPTVESTYVFGLPRHRLLTMAAMVVVTLFLNYVLSRKPSGGDQPSL